MTIVRSVSIAVSSGISGAGLILSVTVRTRSRWRISVGPTVISMSASELSGRIRPEAVTTGIWPMPWVSAMWF